MVLPVASSLFTHKQLQLLVLQHGEDQTAPVQLVLQHGEDQTAPVQLVQPQSTAPPHDVVFTVQRNEAGTAPTAVRTPLHTPLLTPHWLPPSNWCPAAHEPRRRAHLF
ncbi:hypothetical protein INR49_029696 [Caranx melampygus]|nr:hypothetical protein INR49_029696 [Caranx melampygus]